MMRKPFNCWFISLPKFVLFAQQVFAMWLHVFTISNPSLAKNQSFFIKSGKFSNGDETHHTQQATSFWHYTTL